MATDYSSAELLTRAGVRLFVRPVRNGDDSILEQFFNKVTTDDLRFRFLTGLNTVSRSQIAAMTDVDHKHTEDFLAFAEDRTTLLATALIASDESLDRAEVAIAVRADHKNKGLGWSLLDHVAHYATARGIKSLESIESRANQAAIEVERDLGFTVRSYPDDQSLVIVSKQLA